MTSDSYLSAKWKDPALAWDNTLDDYADNSHILIPSNSIWMPGIQFNIFSLFFKILCI
jgi:hypothetical protein